VELDPALEATRAVRILRAVGASGYHKAKVTSGWATFDGEWYVKTPLDGNRILTLIKVSAGPSGGYVTRVRGGPGCKRKLVEQEVQFADAIASSIDAVCKGATPCTELVEIDVDPKSNAGAIATTVRDVLALPALKGTRIRLGLFVPGGPPELSYA